MAHNRMVLFHRPTGRGVLLGKRMAWGWYGVPGEVADLLQELYHELEMAESDVGHQDDFALAFEAVDEELGHDLEWSRLEGPDEKGLYTVHFDADLLERRRALRREIMGGDH